MKKPSLTRLEWQRHIDDWQSSGLQQVEYARIHHINPKSLSSWNIRLQNTETASSEKARQSSNFVPLTVVDSDIPRRQPEITVRIGRAEICYTHEMNDTLFLKLIRTLDAAL